MAKLSFISKPMLPPPKKHLLQRSPRIRAQLGFSMLRRHAQEAANDERIEEILYGRMKLQDGRADHIVALPLEHSGE